MDIGDYRRLISEAEAKIDNYDSMATAISNLITNLNGCSSKLSDAGAIISTKLVDEKGPLDNGKVSEIASGLSDCSSKLVGIAASITTAKQDLGSKITNWNNEIEKLEEEEN